jgi:hypothetical protein
MDVSTDTAPIPIGALPLRAPQTPARILATFNRTARRLDGTAPEFDAAARSAACALLLGGARLDRAAGRNGGRL